MSLCLIISSILLFISLTCVSMGHFWLPDYNDNWKVSGWLFTGIVLTFGFGIFGSELPVRHTYDPIYKFQYVKTPTGVIFITEKKDYTSQEPWVLAHPESIKHFYIKYDINSYGFEIYNPEIAFYNNYGE